ncbi:zinc ribbon domain-containing protein [Youngiibacter multivorans]|uniref:Rubrerythrin n=1 Tax=Youngiibacter multivorans TaxID=937251 RepID=A0ABS4G7X6_9CLOT|nr:zinc ribbon domain-containing protein [Youngiibacter multivorans]MBP1920673.1 rubrerythrin [Youngiibacter multivorans]
MAFEKTFFCTQCGNRLSGKNKVCRSCGFDIDSDKPYGDKPALGAGGTGWSEAVNDYRFAGYQGNRRTYITIFTLILVIAIPSFLLLSGDLGLDSEGIMVIAVLSGMFLLIALYSIMNTRRKGLEWTGIVEDKREYYSKKNSHQSNVIIVKTDNGKMVELPMGDNLVQYEYFKLGDKLKKHNRPNLRAIEKYDKRSDEVLFCPSCGTLCDTRDNYCKACGSPLLKGR